MRFIKDNVERITEDKAAAEKLKVQGFHLIPEKEEVKASAPAAKPKARKAAAK